MSDMSETSVIAKATLLRIAVMQGLMILGLFELFEAKIWPSQTPLLYFPLWTIVMTAPTLLLLSLEKGNERRALTMVGQFTGVLMLLALYVGWQAEPFAQFPITNLTLIFALTLAIAVFKALMYIQQRAAQLPLSYHVLFTYSWRNFLVVAFTGFFVLACFLLLQLWAALFRVIDINFFTTLFSEPRFMIPALALANGLGITIFRDLTRVIDTITRLLQGMIKLLLPLVVLMSAIFVLALPFTGLTPLWATGNGTSLLLWLIAIILFCSNAVYQDGREKTPYPLLVHRIIYIGMCGLPILCSLSLYGLTLRLNQYGFTIGRSWGLAVCLILSLFAIGYTVGIISKRDEWPKMLAKVNTQMSIVVLMLMLLSNSPALDFRKISLDSQLARLHSGEIELSNFDYYYAKQYLARPGHQAVEEIKSALDESESDLLSLINSALPTSFAKKLPHKPEEIWHSMVYLPTNMEVPRALKRLMEQQPTMSAHAITADGRADAKSYLIELDLNEDGQFEYVLFKTFFQNVIEANYFHLHSGDWRRSQLAFSRGQMLENIDFEELYNKGEITIEVPAFHNIKIGELVFTPN
jgi:hypothetical protein